jgi:hypothetical protein
MQQAAGPSKVLGEGQQQVVVSGTLAADYYWWTGGGGLVVVDWWTGRWVVGSSAGRAPRAHREGRVAALPEAARLLYA